MERRPRMKRTIVVTRNGRTTVVAGWRATLMLAAGSLVAALGLALLAILILGAAVTLATGMVFALPLALILLVLSAVFIRARPR